MKRVLLTLLTLALASLACTQAVVPFTPTAAPSRTPAPSVTAQATVSPSASAEAVNSVTIQAIVYIRQSADATSAAIGSLTTGDTVEIVECLGEWCQIKSGGYVFRGCTNNNPDELKCEAKP